MDTASPSATPLVGVIMGSTSDWETMRHAVETLDTFGICNERHVISAHRAPDRLSEYARSARARGLRCIIAGAGAAAHLAGVTAAQTELPVLGVPIESTLKGIDSLLSTVQMPGGIPVATFAIGKPGAVNAALFAVAMLALGDAALAGKLSAFRAEQTRKVLDAKLG
jgi:5-(carboxyamino)imidazole ribonucleotide mutase